MSLVSCCKDLNYVLKDSYNFLATIDDDVIDLYLSLTRRILFSENALEAEHRNTAIQSHSDKCVDLLKHRPSCKVQ